MIRYKLALTLTLIIFSFLFSGILGMPLAWATGIEVEFEKVIGHRQIDRGFTAQQTDDGGYVVAGETLSYYMHGSGGYDAYLAKFDASGLLKWQKTYGGGNDDRVFSVQQTDDGGYIMAGVSQSYFWSTDKNVFLIKTNSSGTEQWHKTYGGPGEDSGTCVLQTGDGGYIIVGETNSSGAGDKDIYLLKTSALGKLEWEKTFGGKSADIGKCVQQTEDGGYLVVGQTYSFGAGNYDIYMIKTDKLGNKEWEKTFGGSDFDKVSSMQQTDDGGYILVGQTSSYSEGGSDACLIKTDGNGNKQWEKNLSINGWAVGNAVQQTDDQGYTLVGWTRSLNNGELHFFLVKTDANGEESWKKTLAGSKFDERFSIQPTNDGGYLITGWCADLLGWTKTRNDDVQVYVMKVKIEDNS